MQMTRTNQKLSKTADYFENWTTLH